MKSSFTAGAQAVILYNECENDTFKISATSSRGQWVNRMRHTVHSVLFLIIVHQLPWLRKAAINSLFMRSILWCVCTKDITCLHDIMATFFMTPQSSYHKKTLDIVSLATQSSWHNITMSLWCQTMSGSCFDKMAILVSCHAFSEMIQWNLSITTT